MDRLAWPFPTPNVAGVLWAAAVVMLLGGLCLPGIRQALPLLRHGWRIGCGLGLIVALALLVCTGSRAGWLACWGGILMLALGRCAPWKLVAAIGGLWLVLTLSMPTTNRRLTQDPTQDSSIALRLGLWRATIAVIADHPWTGVGLERLPVLLDDWYLPDHMRQRFGTALNDGLTLAATTGLPALGLVIGTLLVFFSALARSRPPQDTGPLSLRSGLSWISAAMLLVVVIAGQFQAHLWSWWQVQWLALAAAGMIIVTLIINARPSNGPAISLRVPYLLGLMSAILIPTGILLVDRISKRVQGLCTSASGKTVLVSSANEAAAGTLLLHFGPMYRRVAVHDWTRTFVNAGWNVLLIDDASPSVHADVPITYAIYAGELPDHILTDVSVILINPEGDLEKQMSIIGLSPIVMLSRSAPFVETEFWLKNVPAERLYKIKTAEDVSRKVLEVYDGKRIRPMEVR